MRRRRWLPGATIVIASAVLLSCGPHAIAETGNLRSGHIHWNDWDLTWETTGGQGLEMRNVTFKNVPVLTKASMPVVRVGYRSDWPWWHPSAWWPFSALEATDRGGRCGPFQHRITWSRLRPIPACGNSRVCIDSYFSGGIEWLELGVLAEIGEQEIYQVWYLSDDGQINAGVQSGGLSCAADHVHHAYWRFDFTDEDGGAYEVFVHDQREPDTGWGPGWRPYTTELDAEKNPETGRKWLVHDHHSGTKIWIVPGPQDGRKDGFSDRDVSVRVFKDSEDEPWIFGTRNDLGYNDGESIQQSDLAFWYIAHLAHRAEDGPYPATPQAGPILRVQPSSSESDSR